MSRLILVVAVVALSGPLSGFCSNVWTPAARAAFADELAASASAYQAAHASAPAPTPAPAGPGVVYSQAQLEGALRGTGMAAGPAHVGGAIGEAESGGRSDAVHLCPPACAPGQLPEQSYGPWQINRLAHPGVSVDCAEALGCAAQVTARISGGGSDWSPWSTYTHNTWRAYA